MGELMKMLREIDPRVMSKAVSLLMSLKNQACKITAEGERERLNLMAEIDGESLELSLSYPKSQRARLGI